MERLTKDKDYQDLKDICEGLEAVGQTPAITHLRYIKLAEYEQTGYEPADLSKAVGGCVGFLGLVGEGLQLNKWISVKERMPEERDWYLGIFEDEFGTKTIPIVCDYVGCVAPSTTDEGWILSNITDNMEIPNVHEYYKHLKCLYWTYLPEPPKGVQDDA